MKAIKIIISILILALIAGSITVAVHRPSREKVFGKIGIGSTRAALVEDEDYTIKKGIAYQEIPSFMLDPESEGYDPDYEPDAIGISRIITFKKAPVANALVFISAEIEMGYMLHYTDIISDGTCNSSSHMDGSINIQSKMNGSTIEIAFIVTGADAEIIASLEEMIASFDIKLMLI